MMAHTCDPSTGGAEAGGLQQVWASWNTLDYCLPIKRDEVEHANMDEP